MVNSQADYQVSTFNENYWFYITMWKQIPWEPLMWKLVQQELAKVSYGLNSNTWSGYGVDH